MHFGMRSDRFPLLLDYEAALKKESSIAPLRSKYAARKGTKPLAERTRTWLTIRRVERLGGECDVVIKLHRTDIITYRPNGEIVIDQGGWDSSTTHETIGRILGTTIWRKHSVTWISVKNGFFPLHGQRRNLFLREREPNGEAGRLFYLNPEFPVIHKLRIRDYNSVKKKYAKFSSYAINMTKLSGALVYDNDEYNRLFLGMGDAECTEMVAEWMRTDDFDSHIKALTFVYRWCDRFAKDPVIAVTNAITSIIKRVHRHEVFDYVEVRDGRIVKDTNLEFFGN